MHNCIRYTCITVRLPYDLHFVQKRSINSPILHAKSSLPLSTIQSIDHYPATHLPANVQSEILTQPKGLDKIVPLHYIIKAGLVHVNVVYDRLTNALSFKPTISRLIG